MTKAFSHSDPLSSAKPRPGFKPRPMVLAVDLSADTILQMPRHVVAPGSAVAQVDLAEIAPDDVVGAHAPDLILAPLMTRGVDAMDLLRLLSDAGFRGRVLILAPPLPDIALIRQELLTQAPDLNLDVMAMDGSPSLHLA